MHPSLTYSIPAIPVKCLLAGSLACHLRRPAAIDVDGCDLGFKIYQAAVSLHRPTMFFHDLHKLLGIQSSRVSQDNLALCRKITVENLP